MAIHGRVKRECLGDVHNYAYTIPYATYATVSHIPFRISHTHQPTSTLGVNTPTGLCAFPTLAQLSRKGLVFCRVRTDDRCVTERQADMNRQCAIPECDKAGCGQRLLVLCEEHEIKTATLDRSKIVQTAEAIMRLGVIRP